MYYHPDFNIGVLGGGQLGRMLIQEGINWNLSISCLDPDPQAPCSTLAKSFTVGDLQDAQTVFDFGKDMDVVTIEIEHVSIEGLRRLEDHGVRVYPSPDTLEMIQDKGLQKTFYAQNQIPSSPFQLLNSGKELQPSDLPCVLKMRKGGYDGKGVQVLQQPADLEQIFDVPSIREEMVSFDKEISVIVARNPSGQTASFPVVDMEFSPTANLVEFLFSPAHVADDLREKARKIAENVADKMQLVGILAVEMFLLSNGDILVNEAAPRPHNSGHQTIEGNVTSQYQQLLRAILDLPLGDTAISKPSVMVNILGEDGYAGNAVYQGLEKLQEQSGVFVHLYGKEKTKPFRKMGHFTVVKDTLEEAKKLAYDCKNWIKVISNES